MKLLFNHPRKSAWQLPRVTRPDGTVLYYTGSASGYGWRMALPRLQAEGRLEMVANVVCSGSFALDAKAWEFVDADTGDRYGCSDGVRLRFLEAFIEGRLRSEARRMTGMVTFAKEGERISLAPYTGSVPASLNLPAVPSDAPPDAVDLSDFVRGLARG